MDELLEFFQSVFHLEDKEVEWGIIEVTTREDGFESTQRKPGLLVKDSRVCLDLFARRFYSLVDRPDFTRKIYPAKMLTEENGLVMIDEDEPDNKYVDGKMVIEAKHDDRIFLVYDDNIFSRIYFVVTYDPILEEELML